jgi:integrase
MPARQRGFARKRGDRWQAGWYEAGKQRTRSAFATKTEALDYANGKAAKVVELELAQRFGDELPPATPTIATIDELAQAFLDRKESDVDPATHTKLKRQLKRARDKFGDRPVASLQPIELDVWRAELPARSRHYFFRAFRQVLEYGVAMDVLESNPTARIRNVRASVDRREIVPFDSWEQVEAAAAEMPAHFAAIPLFAVGTGLRPEEWIALERRDLDLNEGTVSVERVYSGGRLKDCKKSDRQRRRLPLRGRIVDVLKALPPRLDTKLLFPAPRSGYIDLERFRYRAWTPALVAAGIAHRRVYDARHTYATWSIAAGVDLFTLSRRMGTSVPMIDATYGHLTLDADERERVLLDAFDRRAAAAAKR